MSEYTIPNDLLTHQ
jgi:hypothetical protein